MNCPTCQDSGHDPAAPWLLCPKVCEAALQVRERSAGWGQDPEPYRGANDLHFHPKVQP
jgi:hypothetical protein